MCMLGLSTKRVILPRNKALTAYKRVTRYGGPGYRPATVAYRATNFMTKFREDGKRLVDEYRVGHTYTTVAPTMGRNDGAGNERGFWAWASQDAPNLGTHTMGGPDVGYCHPA
jgi:hypothetical protein